MLKSFIRTVTSRVEMKHTQIQDQDILTRSTILLVFFAAKFILSRVCVIPRITLFLSKTKLSDWVLVLLLTIIHGSYFLMLNQYFTILRLQISFTEIQKLP